MSATGAGDDTDVLRGKAILVAEDEYFLAADISRALTTAGAEVVGPFASVADALSAMDGDHPLFAALIDINLRGEMVFPLADVLRQRGVPFVFMTGYDRAALPLAYRDAPLCDKPVSIGDFARQLGMTASPP